MNCASALYMPHSGNSFPSQAFKMIRAANQFTHACVQFTAKPIYAAQRQFIPEPNFSELIRLAEKPNLSAGMN